MRPGQVRGANSAVLLELLQRHERLSRADLARYSGLSEGTVSRIVTDLIGRKLVMEDGAENSTGGRPAICLRLEQNRFAVGVDVHSWETQFGVGTMRGRMVETLSIAHAAGSGVDDRHDREASLSPGSVSTAGTSWKVWE